MDFYPGGFFPEDTTAEITRVRPMKIKNVIIIVAQNDTQSRPLNINGFLGGFSPRRLVSRRVQPRFLISRRVQPRFRQSGPLQEVLMKALLLPVRYTLATGTLSSRLPHRLP